MRPITIIAAALATAAALAAGISSSWADGYGHSHGSMPMQTTSHTPKALTQEIADLRIAYAPLATSVDAAKQAGYSRQITPMMENMGIHFMDPTVAGFDPKRPPILVYERKGDATQLAAVEWVFPAKPKTAPLPGAKYGSFPAACHYADGTFVEQRDEKACATSSKGSAFTFWHPLLVTMHLWIYYPNPDGLFNSTNPLVAPFN
jgi:hypothetical protein